MAASLATMAQMALLDSISETISEQNKDATFACGGSLSISDQANTEESTITPVHIRCGESGKGITVTLPASPDNTELDALINACTPAPFGVGNKEVLDDSYRKATKLDPTQFATTFDPYGCGIIDVVSQLLLPNVATDPCKRGVRAEMYKLNVYQAPSGMFKAHVDTPRSEDQFGSLVVALPVPHKGGQLLVRGADGGELRFDWSEKSSSTLQWVAFYSDCEHEVLEVTSGHRLTLTCNLYVKRGAGDLGGQVPKSLLDPTKLPLYDTLKAALETPGFLKKGRLLGLYLTHCYAHTTDDHLNLLPSSYKGTDMLLYHIAQSLGLTCSVRPLMLLEYYDFGWSKVTSTIKATRPDFVPYRTAHFYHGKDGWDGEDLSEGVLAEGWGLWGYEKVTWLKKRRDELLEPALAHAVMGNDPQARTQYTAAVLLLRIPPMSERGADILAPEDVFEGVTRDEEIDRKASGALPEDDESDSDESRDESDSDESGDLMNGELDHGGEGGDDGDDEREDDERRGDGGYGGLESAGRKRKRDDTEDGDDNGNGSNAKHTRGTQTAENGLYDPPPPYTDRE